MSSTDCKTNYCKKEGNVKGTCEKCENVTQCQENGDTELNYCTPKGYCTTGTPGTLCYTAESDDEWANGSNGYLKTAAVIAMFEQAGFEFVASSEVNANPKDKPQSGDSVWRLPPSLRTAPENKAVNIVIGESDRMALKFVKK